MDQLLYRQAIPPNEKPITPAELKPMNLQGARLSFGRQIALNVIMNVATVDAVNTAGLTPMILQVDFVARGLRFTFSREGMSYMIEIHAYDIIYGSINSNTLTLALDNPPRYLAMPAAKNREQLNWQRITHLPPYEDPLMTQPLSYQMENVEIDIGKAMCFRYDLTRSSELPKPNEIAVAINSLTPAFLTQSDNKVKWVDLQQSVVWSLINHPLVDKDSSILSMIEEKVHLPFTVRYMLEVCLCERVINSHSITLEWLRTLQAMEPERASSLLEQAVASNVRLLDPTKLFHLRGTRARRVWKSSSEEFVRIRSGIVTPTRFMPCAPTLETSNNVFRHFRRVLDRFIRIKFTEEQSESKLNLRNRKPEAESSRGTRAHRGRNFQTQRGGQRGRGTGGQQGRGAIGQHGQGTEAQTSPGIQAQYNRDGDALSQRIKNVLRNGIRIGDRVYEFLHFSNSQLKDNSAYFFANEDGDGITAEHIRKWIGNIDHERVVAKHAARLAQAFSTTRAIHTVGSNATVHNIHDIERNGVLFTDGVGKMSQLTAKLIAHEWGLIDPPSLVQFRACGGGWKGVLTVCNNSRTNDDGNTSQLEMPGIEIAVRPSQQKFGNKFTGLHICKVSNFGIAALNRQIMAILYTLGIKKEVFINKTQALYRGLDDALNDEARAVSILRRQVDKNETTLFIADMVTYGFLKRQDPFIRALLGNWYSWSLKLVKDKGRIPIPKSAFVLGCVDECAVLQGYYPLDKATLKDATRAQLESALPEIFLQIPCQDQNGKYEIIEGICIVGRSPCLHPGDIRVVRAVNKPELNHLRNVVVFPQTGDQDIPSMCSGGDLDGDEYFVFWDPSLVPAPSKWNHKPMQHTSVASPILPNPVTTEDTKEFFLTYMKQDNLGQIANAHLTWFDKNTDPFGVSHEKCLKLANLHSIAVDFAKTGVPAIMDPDLFVRQKPHYLVGPVFLKYHSESFLGMMYDGAKEQAFEPDYSLPFDRRILNAFDLEPEVLEAARSVKESYDTEMRNMLRRSGIKTEFEVFSTFILQHNYSGSDYRFIEKMGDLMSELRQSARKECAQAAGASTPNDFGQMERFIAAMYTVTAMEAEERLKFEETPMISFPWIFGNELGRIARAGNAATSPKFAEVTIPEPAPRPAPESSLIPPLAPEVHHQVAPPSAACASSSPPPTEGPVLPNTPNTLVPVPATAPHTLVPPIRVVVQTTTKTGSSGLTTMWKKTRGS
ncbi:RdRP-domain-containing protein [Patellaria atrata CBS 101060]|uniref:RNA-dependent RNA polymerase n=1 Tax=Patellaria atrata CBS 101060 TaxID=1346257 RepID=A0A9P4SAE0_9PEZI|nr:RdRP-domain-containing protein [Patellaria atrata CBS 101060]